MERGVAISADERGEPFLISFFTLSTLSILRWGGSGWRQWSRCFSIGISLSFSVLGTPPRVFVEYIPIPLYLGTQWKTLLQDGAL